MIVGNAGILVPRVIYVKHGDGKNFVIIDAAMNDLIRPTLYEAHHDILPVTQPARGRATIIGRRGRPGLRDRRLSRAGPHAAGAEAGDLIAIMTAGAYGAVQAGTYNTRRAGAGSAGQGRPIRGGASAHRGRAADRDGHAGAVAVSGSSDAAKRSIRCRPRERGPITQVSCWLAVTPAPHHIPVDMGPGFALARRDDD